MGRRNGETTVAATWRRYTQLRGATVVKGTDPWRESALQKKKEKEKATRVKGASEEKDCMAKEVGRKADLTQKEDGKA